jgi:two-component system nitrate/nitrite response regulator NarL
MRIVLIDDHALFRVGLKGLLERSGIEVIGCAGNGREGIELVRELNPDIVLLDMRIPDMSGIEVLKALRDSGAEMPVVMLTTSDRKEDLVESLKCGAQGYLLKEMEPDELVTALHNIMEGKTVIAPDLTGVLAQAVQGGEEEPREEESGSPFATLTPREMEILTHLAIGQSNKVIARDLGISIGTVKLHVKAILRKLGVHSRVEAAVMAVENGITRN